MSVPGYRAKRRMPPARLAALLRAHAAELDARDDHIRRKLLARADALDERARAERERTSEAT